MQIKTKVRGGPRGCGGGVIIAVRSDALAAIP
ncbi:hypothetical protein SAMN05443572_110193 [Myxococcus fulvus]|jgi:hypothetical protein|uniref:Uncharacterized protein n=1 Tax=Myxococcus fulvus TaxID=33 RepID=A0ABY1CSM9_MYXFU|nr:hypothetical protein MFUL124B02_14300 [Myxococcus fulvus 124B02]SEU35071.1 hypothetical protein SAMN05443572_110193 [Myxococcus fulvus]